MNSKIVVITVISVIVLLIASLLLQNRNPVVGLACMMRKPKDLRYWLEYHMRKGVSYFYIRLEDTPELEDYLKTFSNVFVEIGSSSDKLKTAVTYDTQMERQRDYTKRAIAWSRDRKIDWLIHIDCDELIECDGLIGDAICNELSSHPSNVEAIVMENYEAQYNKINQPNDLCFISKRFIRCSEGGCTSYANGKSIGKVTNKLSEAGPHRFAISETAVEVVSKKIRVLHFESCDFRQYVSKFIRLAKTETQVYPFKFYNDSLQVARSKECLVPESIQCLQKFESVYARHKLI